MRCHPVVHSCRPFDHACAPREARAESGEQHVHAGLEHSALASVRESDRERGGTGIPVAVDRVDDASLVEAEPVADRGTSALFADGAGAAVVTAAREGRGSIGPIVLRSDGRGGDSIRASREEQIIHMQGHDTFKAAVLRMSEATLEATRRAGVELDDVSLFVYHQANARILAAVAERLSLDDAKVVNSIDRFGNTSSATLPIALADARERGLLEPGMTVLLSAFGAGFTWGAGVIEWAA